MRNNKSLFLRTFIAVLILIAGASTFYASELIYLPLQREGQASIAIDEKKKTAYVVDLGRGGDGNRINLDSVPLLDRLEQLGIKDLFFVCSHPHSDHMGGIRALVEQPSVFFKDEQLANPRFRSITIIDDSLSSNLYQTLQRTLRGNNLIKIGHLSATGQNAFEGISSRADDVHIETIPYQIVNKGGVHGRAVITLIKLNQTNAIVDFDDADSKAIAKVVAVLKARGETLTAFVVPHHGSRYHDVEPILDLKPKYAVIAVNPENRYGHPSPPILLKLMEKLGKRNVVFTGSEEKVVLDDSGIKQALYTAANQESYAMFVAQNRIKAEKNKNKEDIRDCELIQKMMMDDDGGAGTPGGPAVRLFEEEVRFNGSILQPDFELGAVTYGSDGPNALQAHKIFALAAPASKDLTGKDVAVILERSNVAEGETIAALTPSEARQVSQQLQMLGNNAERAKNVYVYFVTSTGFRSAVESALVTQPAELLRLSTPPATSSVPRSNQRLGRAPRGKIAPNTSPDRGSTRIPSGGMVFLRGDKLFPTGEAGELLGGQLDLCGTSLCVKTIGGGTSSDSAYILPFSPGRLFSEVWTRVFENKVDSFYLSINPTKQFIQNLDSSFGRIPSDKLHFGTGAAGTGQRTHEVVTAGNIENSQIGKILWEADVAFKSQSLGFNVLTGERGAFTRSARALNRKGSEAEAGSLGIPYTGRWCRLYWTSGAQSIEVKKGTNLIRFNGDAVIARSEPMTIRNGSLVDAPQGSWCGETKNVAYTLQQQANSGHAQLEVLNQLRELAEIQSFVRWARDNGIAPTSALNTAIAQSASGAASEIPSWTSGVKAIRAGRLQVQQQRSVTKRGILNLLHVSLADTSMASNCVRPNWDAREYEFPANGIVRDALGVWNIPPDKYHFIDSWMAALAGKIASCSRGEILPSLTAPRYEGISDPIQGTTDQIGITYHLQAISSEMHGGVLLGLQRGFLETAWRKGLLLARNRKPIFQNENGKLHFWSFTENHPQFGSFGQHIVMDSAQTEEAYARDGMLSFLIKINPGAIARQELRWSHANRFARGVEWAGARHLSDGSWIWAKSAAPCNGDEAKKTPCIQLSETSLAALKARLGGKPDDDLTIHVAQVDDEHWRVDLNISSIGLELEQQWEKTPAANLNKRISLIYDYAKWGFITEALKKYEQIASKIEGNTVDTILLRQLEMSRKEN